MEVITRQSTDRRYYCPSCGMVADMKKTKNWRGPCYEPAEGDAVRVLPHKRVSTMTELGTGFVGMKNEKCPGGISEERAP